jgi:hypothetical protein
MQNLEALPNLLVEVRIRSIVDIHKGKLKVFLKWVLSNPRISSLIKGFNEEPLVILMARYTKEIYKYNLALARYKSEAVGRPPKAKFFSQKQVLEALRDHKTGLEAARALGMSYMLLYLIAKGKRGNPTPIEELRALDLEKWIPSKANPRKSKKLLAINVIKV